MKTSNTFGVQFIVRPSRKKKDNNRLPVYARISVNGRRLEISLKTTIASEDWIPAKEKAKGSRTEIKEFNQYLSNVRAKINGCYRELLMSDKTITAEAIKNLYLGNKPQEHTLQKLITYHNETLKDILAQGTLKNYFTTQRYLEKFLKNRSGSIDLGLSDLDYQFITDFEHYLRTYIPVDHQKRLSNNGVMKHLERLRKMVNMAVKMEWISKDPFARYRLRFQKKSREFLSSGELQAIESKQLSIDRLDYVRDLFVFSCYSGLAYIDVIELKPENINIGIDGELWITTYRAKTSQPVRIPLLPKALSILKKYENNPRSLNSQRVFPRISNQKLNSYLKELADLCNIRKPLTFHIARHTFATTVTLTNGVPIETVSKLLGHTSIKTTQIYAKIVEEKICSDMHKLRDTLNQKHSISLMVSKG